MDSQIVWSTQEISTFLEVSKQALHELFRRKIVVKIARDKWDVLESLKNYRDFKEVTKLDLHFEKEIRKKLNDLLGEKVDKEGSAFVVDKDLSPIVAIVESPSPGPTKEKRPEEKDFHEEENFQELKKMEIKEKIMALRIDNEKKLSKLVDRDDFEKKMIKMFKSYQVHLLAMPERVADELHGETDYWNIVKVLDKYLRQSLEDLSRWPEMVDGLL